MMGLMQEHGPYIIPEGKQDFVKNPWAWNREANVFYIDAPSTVGFSICKMGSDNCNYDDAMTAEENLDAVILLLKKFPEIQLNDIYIAGESFAGIFVPQLAEKIEEWNKNCTLSKKCDIEPNLKGFIVGNGFTTIKHDNLENRIDMAYWFGLIDEPLFELMKVDGCSFSVPIAN
jgi:serine carboxypeptidase-like clade 2